MRRRVERFVRGGAGVLLVGVTAMVGPACARPTSTVPPVDAAARPRTAAEIQADLEAKILAGRETVADRKRAYEAVRSVADDGSAEYAYARAAVIGRLAEARGAGAGALVGEAEAWARRSIERDPRFGDFAATRMLGTLYVLAPGRLVEHGDSEDGLSMLERLVDEQPENPRNQLRLAQAYAAFGDLDAAREPLCRALSGRQALPADEIRLLDRLVAEAGGANELACSGSA